MSVLGIVVIVFVVLAIVFFIGGLIAARRHADATADSLNEKIAAADRALEAARAADRGWDRALLDQAARTAIEQAKPGFRYDALHLILVEDRPGIHEDRAHMTAVGPDGELPLILVRHGDEAWHSEPM